MVRIKLTLPSSFTFFAKIPIRITDVNYGNHLGNDALLSLIHEARMQYLQSHGYTEMNVGGAGLIMNDAAIEFKAEAFYGDVLTVYVAAAEFTRAGFNLYYRLLKESDETIVALAKTGMVCFDYKSRKITAVPEEVVEELRD